MTSRNLKNNTHNHAFYFLSIRLHACYSIELTNHNLWDIFLLSCQLFIIINCTAVNIFLHLFLCLIRYISMNGLLYFKTISIFLVPVIWVYYRSKIEEEIWNIYTCGWLRRNLTTLPREKKVNQINWRQAIARNFSKIWLWIFSVLLAEISIWDFNTSWLFF